MYWNHKSNCTIYPWKFVHKPLPNVVWKLPYCTYGITVWGSISDVKQRKLFLAQKKISRVLFGDREKFKNKFKTCVRSRPNEEQKIFSELYVKERSKPLFINNKILNLKNLYSYHCTNEIFKILKFRSPIAINDRYNFSNRGHKHLFTITPAPSECFIYKSSVLWNKMQSILSIKDASFSVSNLKKSLTVYLLNLQSLGDRTRWIDDNFFSLWIVELMVLMIFIFTVVTHI